jgi:hypothetical protein
MVFMDCNGPTVFVKKIVDKTEALKYILHKFYR